MEFIDLVQSRRSTRAFMADGPEEVDLARILEVTCMAPSAGNLQAYEIYVAREVTVRQALARAAYGQDFIADSSAVLVFCANPVRNEQRYGLRGRDLYSVQDATIACTYAMMAVVDGGLATVWVGSFDPEEVRVVIGAPEGQLPVAMLPIGYPGERPEEKTRRALRDLVHEIS